MKGNLKRNSVLERGGILTVQFRERIFLFARERYSRRLLNAVVVRALSTNGSTTMVHLTVVVKMQRWKVARMKAAVNDS